MGVLGWLDRMAGRLNRKVGGTATPAAATVIQGEEAEKVEAEDS